MIKLSPVTVNSKQHINSCTSGHQFDITSYRSSDSWMNLKQFQSDEHCRKNLSFMVATFFRKKIQGLFQTLNLFPDCNCKAS